MDSEEDPPNGHQRHGKDAEGFIDVSSANRRVWLVKIPEFIAGKLDEVENDNGETDVYIGSVRTVQSSSGQGSQLVIHLDENGPMTDVPLDYTLSSVKPLQQMHLMIESPETGEALAIHGKVEQECYMMPILDDERYRSLLRSRTAEANRPKRTVQVVQPHEQRVGMIRHVTEHSLLAQQSKRRVEVDQKRERLPQSEVLSMIFGLFERFERLSFNDLMGQTQQPAAYLKEILSEVAVYNKRGPHKNLYELLPEYSTGKRRMDGH